ncbi:MAG: threonylcarbamoyl-AMP synthase [Clostridia bacterium]|nr:threonylcarbamoyl-AMP synthase [Clostridia bacterium]
MKTEIYKLGVGCDDEVFEKCGEIIRRRGVVAFPTETVYGLGVGALSGECVPKVFEAKGRPSDNPLIVHIAYPDDAALVAETSREFFELAQRFMPGPLTVIMPKKDIVPYEVTAGLDSVGIRCPSHDAAHRLILAAGVPIAAPSANISGAPSPTSFEHVYRDMNGKVDAIIDGGECDFGLESTVILLDGKSARILRPGAVTKEDLLEVLESVTVDPAVKDPAAASSRPASPGMKYKHYAPAAEFRLIDSNAGAFRDYVNSLSGNVGVICLESESSGFTCKCKYTISEEHSVKELCHKLFSIFRRADDDGIEILCSRLPDDSGAGLALYNRMIRAAGNRIIRLD